MRAKTLSLGLGVLLALGCDDQSLPTEVLDHASGDLTESAVTTNEWIEDQEFLFEACGEMHTSYYTAHVVEKWTETPNGDWKWKYHENLYNHLIVSESGKQYRGTPWAYNFWVKGTWGGPDPWHEHQTARLVAHGINVDVKLHTTWIIHLKRLETGEVVKDFFVNDTWCK